jgi:rhodanese-related sulfurtransferase
MAILVLVAGALGIIVNLLRSDRLPLVGDWSPKALLTLPSGDDLAVPVEEARQAWFLHTAVFVDARPQDQFLLGHIEGACNIPWEAFDHEFPQVKDIIPQGTPIITYCDGEGCGLSRELAVAMLGMGYTNVRVLANGWSLWQMEHLPVATGNSDCASGASTEHGTPQQGQ